MLYLLILLDRANYPVHTYSTCIMAAHRTINEAPMVRGLAANKFTKHNALHT